MAKGKLAVNLIREIRHTGMRFLSILAIAFLGTAFFAGLRSACPDMQLTGDKMFDEGLLADITAMSSGGITPEDVRAIAAMPGVEAVEPVVAMDAMMLVEGADEMEKNIHLISMPFAIPEERPAGMALKPSLSIDQSAVGCMNRLTVLAGRLPLDDHEVALDAVLAKKGVAIGDWVVFSTPGGSVRLRVVGFVESAKYISHIERGSSTVGTGESEGFAYASGNAIGRLGTRLPMMAMLSARYTEVNVQVEGALALNSFSDEYAARVSGVMREIEAYGEEGDDTWYVWDRDANPGFRDYRQNADRIGAVAELFPLFFFVVAALVALTTMTRMVEEQRVQMGTFQALGYKDGAILSEYLIYSALATISGGILGCVVGSRLFPAVIMNAYAIMYRMTDIQTPFHYDIAVTAILAAVVCISGAAYVSAISSLKEAPAALMRPKAPKPGKRIFLERIGPLWRRLSFTSKVTARNLIRYKKRFFMSIVGIAGSAALLVTGFGVQDSIYGITERQFGRIWKMDVQAYSYDPMPPEEWEALMAERAGDGNAHNVMFCYDKTMEAGLDDEDTTDAHLFIAGDADQLDALIGMYDDSGAAVALPDEGVLITKKLSYTYNLHAGDEIALTTGNDTYYAKVADIVENYVNHYVFFSAPYYEEVFGKPAEYNGVMAMLNDNSDAAHAALSESLLADQRMYMVSFTTGMYGSITDSFDILGYVVWVLILSAAALSFVVMFNLTNINITERRREMATLQVLGFLDKELYAYVFRENNALAVLGSLVGLGLGKLLHKFVIETCEVDVVMFVRDIKPMSYIVSFLMTIAFSLMVNLFMRRKVRGVDMVESLKSAE